MSFQLISEHGDHEQVVFCRDKKSGLRAIIAIHNTVLGPALGGTRMWNYATEEEALIDVLRLSKGMTYKAASAGLSLGGGKAVIIGDPKTEKTPELFRAFGKYVNSLFGRYITAEDVGTSVQDMEHVFSCTPYVTGISEKWGGSGDPSPYTARGVLYGIKASVEKTMRTDLKGVRVAVQGLGHVGQHLVNFLVEEGAEVIVTDIDSKKVKDVVEKYQVRSCAPDEIIQIDCDVFSPCALGAIINDNTMSQLKCKIIAGGANNQLATPEHGAQLKERNIVYVPDYVINSGGLINVFVEIEGYSLEKAVQETKKVYDNIMTILDIAEREDIPTNEAANRLAEERLDTKRATTRCLELVGGLRERHLAANLPQQ